MEKEIENLLEKLEEKWEGYNDEYMGGDKREPEYWLKLGIAAGISEAIDLIKENLGKDKI